LSELSQLERWLGNLFEAPFRGRPDELDWMEVVQRLMAAAIQGQVRRGDRLFIPHRYHIRLNPSDWNVASAHAETLKRELEKRIGELAHRDGASSIHAVDVRLEPHDALSAGETEVSASFGSESTDAFAARDTLPFATLDLQLWNGLALLLDGRMVPLESPLVRLGRGRDNDVVLDHRTVSRHHARIELSDERHLALDLGSRNGTFLNGRRIKRAYLSDGDVLHLGERALAVCRVRPTGSNEPSPIAS
jgi:hypothetical protein